MAEISGPVWSEILALVSNRQPGLARRWFDQLKPRGLNGGVLHIASANLGQLRYLQSHCVGAFVDAAQSVSGRLISVAFESPNQSPDSVETEKADLYSIIASSNGCGLQLNADYTFENFVVGPCNRMAQASCLAVCQAPGNGYNPLFVYGNAGLGKTHLLQAVCHRVLDDDPGQRIVYLSCESFVNHFVEAVEKGAVHRFRHRYRHADMLLIDDVQFLARGDHTRDEFFHTFNTLYQEQKQIILTADCSPTDIPHLEERMISRFKWGLVARVDAPCLETRLAILQRKMRKRGLEAPPDALLNIASAIHSNSRELEGALNRIQSLAELESRPIDLALTQKALSQDAAPPLRSVKVQDIMGLVTSKYDIKLSDLTGRKRSRSIVLPRQVGMYLARRFTQHSLAEIGGFFGGRDHSTVLHANRLVNDRRIADQAFRADLDQMEDALRHRT